MSFIAVTAAAGIIGVGVGIASASQASKNANTQQGYNDTVTAQNASYRLEVMQYQNEQYAQDVVHYHDTLAYEQTEFDRAKSLVTASRDNIEKDYTQKVGTSLLKAVQEDIAHSLGLKDVIDQGFAATGKVDVSNAERGVAGNSANLLSGEVSRQVGVAKTAVNRNFDAARTQDKLELLGLKGQRDSAVAAQTMPTFAPIEPPAPPAPVSPVNPAAPVARVGTGAAVLNSLSSGLNLAGTAASLANAFKLTPPAP